MSARGQCTQDPKNSLAWRGSKHRYQSYDASASVRGEGGLANESVFPLDTSKSGIEPDLTSSKSKSAACSYPIDKEKFAVSASGLGHSYETNECKTAIAERTLDPFEKRRCQGVRKRCKSIESFWRTIQCVLPRRFPIDALCALHHESGHHAFKTSCSFRGPCRQALDSSDKNILSARPNSGTNVRPKRSAGTTTSQVAAATPRLRCQWLDLEIELGPTRPRYREWSLA